MDTQGVKPGLPGSTVLDIVGLSQNLVDNWAIESVCYVPVARDSQLRTYSRAV